jgi:ribonuclease HII
MISLGYDAPAQTLVDGNQMPPTTMPARCIVRGDSASLSIAAASIIAKHSRDLLMVDLDQSHPGYGWATNMGYGTKQHSAAIEQLGITPHHRRSFAPVRRYLAATAGRTSPI